MKAEESAYKISLLGLHLFLYLSRSLGNKCQIRVRSAKDLLFLFSCQVISDSLRPHGLQHTRLLCPSPSPRVCSNSCLLSWWCFLTISFSIAPFSCLQSFPASRSFPMSQFFASGGQSIGASSPASVLPMNIQGWFPLGWTGLVWPPCCPRDSQAFSPALQFKNISSLALVLLYGPTLASIHDYWKNHSFD